MFIFIGCEERPTYDKLINLGFVLHFPHYSHEIAINFLKNTGINKQKKRVLLCFCEKFGQGVRSQT